MKQIFLFGLLLIISCKSEVQEVVTLQSELENTQQDVASISEAITLEVYDYNGLKPLINKKDDKVHVVNFWATWCAPCVKELPYFEAIKEDYKDDNVEVLLVSLDFPRNYDSKLKPFIKNRNIKSKVVAFDDVDQNTWIPAIDKNWTGALPATIIYNSTKRQFYEQSFTKEELETELKQFLNQ